MLRHIANKNNLNILNTNYNLLHLIRIKRKRFILKQEGKKTLVENVTAREQQKVNKENDALPAAI